MAKFHYRLPPCPLYDTECLESWLEDLARKGWLLDQEGYVFGFFQFQKGAPQTVKYRFEANTALSALDLKGPEDPDADAQALNAQFGWEYWGQFRDYHLYRTTDPDARELNTDPVVQAMALDAVRRRTGFYLALLSLMVAGTLLGFLGTPDPSWASLSHAQTEALTRYLLLGFCALFGIAYLFQEKDHGLLSRLSVLLLYGCTILAAYRCAKSLTPLLDILDRGWLWYLLFGGFLLSCFAASAVSYVHILRLQRRLRRGQTPNREKSWKKGRIQRLFPAVLPFVLLICLNFARTSGRPEEAVPFTEVSQEVPFVTMAQLAPDREYIPVEKTGYNTLRIWSDLLSPVNYQWVENAYLDGENGSRYGGTLSVCYHEAASEAIAKRLVTEYAAGSQPDADLIPDTVDPSRFDYLAVLPSAYHPSILIRQGNIVVHAYCSVQSWGNHEALYPVWLELMAQRLQTAP